VAIIQDEGITLTSRPNLNFVGAGVTVTDNAGTSSTVVTIPGSTGPAMDLDYLGDYVPATYNDGDIVIASDGITYLCVKDGTTTPPEPWPGGNSGVISPLPGVDYAKPSLLDTYANIVAAAHGAPENGRLAMLTDSFYTARCNGSAWQWFFNGVLVNLPPTTGWTWDNQGTATETQAGGYLYLNAPAISGGNTRVRYRTAPGATPWSVTALLIPFVNFYNNQQAGILVRGSAGTKLYCFGPTFSSSVAQLQVVRLNSPTSWNGTPYAQNVYGVNHPMWLRITDNGTNLIFSYSRDGIYFNVAYSEARAGFLTPDQVGYFAETQSTSANASITLISWTVS